MSKAWQPLFDSTRPIVQLIHDQMRYDDTDRSRIQTDLIAIAIRAYESELIIQARRVGCTNTVARLTNPSILSTLENLAKFSADSIVNTYNYDLLVKLDSVLVNDPTISKTALVRELKSWDNSRKKAKIPVVQSSLEAEARSNAQIDFRRLNGPEGRAKLLPKKAVCPICQGWVNRGWVDAKVALTNPPPYHPNCPHVWEMDYETFTESDCRQLWLGGDVGRTFRRNA